MGARTTIENGSALVTGADRGVGRGLVEEALWRGARRMYSETRRPPAHAGSFVFAPGRIDCARKRSIDRISPKEAR